MVLWLVPQNILMEDGVRHLVHAPAQLTHGGDVALVREKFEDLNEELVGQVTKTAGAEILEIAHGGGICGVDEVEMKKGKDVVEILFLMQRSGRARTVIATFQVARFGVTHASGLILGNNARDVKETV